MKNKTINTVTKQDKRTKLTNNVKGIVWSMIVLGFLGFSIKNAVANEVQPSTVSHGNKVANLNELERENVINSLKNSLITDQIIGKALNKSREEIIAEKKQQLGKTLLQRKQSKGVNSLTKNYSPFSERYYIPEFSIYDAVTYLEDDFDADGYYQTFSVVFDADVYNPNGNEESVIYAELFISTNGENWTHYYSTDDFLIQGDNDADQFEVITTFSQGYLPNHYDILIDIYEVGYSDIVATYSSYDDNSLYALPLESADHDNVYIEEIVIHGGSHSVTFLIFICFMGLIKIARMKKTY